MSSYARRSLLLLLLTSLVVDVAHVLAYHGLSYWVTTDGGSTWAHYENKDASILTLEPHPTQPNVALGLGVAQTAAGVHTHAAVTMDAGATWRPVAEYVHSLHWAHLSAHSNEYDAIAYVGLDAPPPNKGPWNFACSSHAGKTCSLYRVPIPASATAPKRPPAALFATAVTFVEISWSGTMPAPYRVLVLCTYEGTDHVHYRYSEDGGVTWTDAQFPYNLRDENMAIVAAESNAFVAALSPPFDDDPEEDPAGGGDGGDGGEVSSYPYSRGNFQDLYVADDRDHGRFARVLRFMHAIVPRRGVVLTSWPDFERGHSIDGVYVVNAYRELEDGARDSECVQTRLSYDAGARWSHVRPPADEAARACPGTNASGSESCSLQLFGLADGSGIARVYSMPGAPGIWFGQGLVAECLPDVADARVGTYMSRDAGATWQRIEHGHHIYEISNHGALLVTATTDRATDTLKYSLDEGASWHSCAFGPQPVDVENVVSRTVNARSFLLYGQELHSQAKNGTQRGVLTYVGFEDVHDGANCTSADMEPWSPADVFEPSGVKPVANTGEPPKQMSCILGTHDVYTRRKQTATCHYPDNHFRPKAALTCFCDEEDYECDFCFQPANGDELLATDVLADPTSACVPSADAFCQAYFVSVSREAVCTAAATAGKKGADRPSYMKLTGLRLAAHDKCKPASPHGLDLRPTSHYCDETDVGAGSGGGTVAVVLILTLVICLGGCFVAHRRGLTAPLVDQINYMRGGPRFQPLSTNENERASGANVSLLDDDDLETANGNTVFDDDDDDFP